MLPNLGTVLGVGAAAFFRLTDPRRKKQFLKKEKRKILNSPYDPEKEEQKMIRVKVIDDAIDDLDLEIDRRAG